jgi:hypothetical protein
MKRFSICFGLLLVVLPCWGGQDIHSNEDTRARKYFTTLYPHGMPLRKSYWTGKMERPRYLVVTMTRTSDRHIVVVTAEELKTNASADKLFTVFISLLEETGPTQRLLDQVDITESSPVQSEIPGNFFDMQAHMDDFEVQPNTHVVHLNWWAVLAGTGGNSAASDLFFATSDGKLRPILELPRTSTYGYAGAPEHPEKSTELFVTDINQDGIKEILAQRWEKGADGKYMRKGNMVYAYDGAKYRESGSLEGKELEEFRKLETEKAPFTKWLTHALEPWSYEH